MSGKCLNRRAFLRSAGGGLLGAGLAGPNIVRGAARKPNIVIVLADDLGYADVGFNGCKDYTTPHIDSIARGGVRFTNGYVSHPFCSPTRSGLMTGRYQQRYGHENNPRYDPHDEVAGLLVTETTVAQVLSQQGYVTGQIGKWHLGAAPKFHPLRRGFQEQYGFIGGGHDYFKAEMEGEPKEYLIPIQRNGKPVVEKEYLTGAFSREAEAFVRRHAKEPFFLYLAYNAPHTPQQVSEKYLSRFSHVQDKKRQLYSAMNTALDDGVGRLLSALTDLKLDDNTLIFFLSDNGGPIGVNGSNNDPLRGGKGSLYEGGIRVPFAARWRGRLPEGKVYNGPVISLDIFPTAVGAGGGQLPRGKKLDGVDILPNLLGKSSRAPHDRLFWRTGGGASFAVREGRYKLFKTREREAQLYDLQSDIGETSDLATARPDLLRKLNQECEAWNGELIPPLFESPNSGRKKKE